MNNFDLPQWQLPWEAYRLSFDEMRLDGARGNEGVALWLGEKTDDTVTVSHVIALRGPGVQKRPDYLFISAELINDVTDVAIERGAFLVGQIHSHGTGYGTDLSDTDKRFGIRVEGYLSLVAPHYATRPETRLEECGVHVFHRGVWRRLDVAAVGARVQLVDTRAELIVVGG